MGIVQGWRRDFLTEVRNRCEQKQKVDDGDYYIVFGAPNNRMPKDDPKRLSGKTLAVHFPYEELAQIYKDTGEKHGKKMKFLKRTGLPPRLDVEMALKGMFHGGETIDVTIDALDYYLVTGKDPYMGWGIGVDWREK